MNLEKFQEQIGVRFDNADLLRQALTHRSYVNEHPDKGLPDNERMEFLGDAVLDFVTAALLYEEYPNMPEGELTRLRAALVRTESLAELAVECGLGDVLFIGKGEDRSGGRVRMNNLCSAFEALVGAIFLDEGLEVAKAFVIPRLTRLLKHIVAEGLHIDARSELQEWSQAELSVTPAYRIVGASGPDHNKQFMIEVALGEKVVGRGIGRSKQAAAQDAARTALKLLERRRDRQRETG